MTPKTLYLLLCIPGTVLPYSALLPFFGEYGVDVRLFIEQMFWSRVGTFFVLDVVVSSVVLWVLVLVEGRRAGVRHAWAPIAANLAVGVSLALPLFLYMREVALERAPANQVGGA
ncbi:MAG TPA: DUF2834 domain-containing protein [Candidatus Eisenbacteria bacterium]|nr:DUF2834 domain-containing protein [Candidatus Eisenbacteria bacterium]